MDVEVGDGKVRPTFRVGNLTSGVIPFEICDWELGKSDFPVQMERNISVVAGKNKADNRINMELLEL